MRYDADRARVERILLSAARTHAVVDDPDAERALATMRSRVQVFGNLATDPQLRAAINQTPECQNLIGANVMAGANQPTG